MAALTNYNFTTDYAEFAIDSAAEIALLPTTSSVGTGKLVDKPVKAGSIAYTTDGNFDFYTLDSSDSWNKVGE